MVGVRRWLWALVAALVLVPAVVAAADPGPSYFSGDDTTDSYGGAGLTWDGTPSYGAGYTGTAGDRAFVVGPNGVLAADDPALGNFGTADFTLHLYVRLPSLGGGDQRVELLSKRGDCAGGSFLDLRAGPSFGGVYFEIQDAANFGFSVTSPADLFDDAWHEITATRAGTRVTLTVDGVRSSGTTNGVVNVDNDTPLRLGDGGCVGTLGDGPRPRRCRPLPTAAHTTVPSTSISAGTYNVHGFLCLFPLSHSSASSA